MKYIKFESLSEAEEASNRIFYNMLIYASKSDVSLVSDCEGDCNEVYDEEKINEMGVANASECLRIFGRSAVSGKINKHKGSTLNYAIPIKAFDIDVWWFAKPCEELMADVINYSEIDEVDPSWHEEE